MSNIEVIERDEHLETRAPENFLPDLALFLIRANRSHMTVDDCVRFFLGDREDRGLAAPYDERLVDDALDVLSLARYVYVDEGLDLLRIDLEELRRDFGDR